MVGVDIPSMVHHNRRREGPDHGDGGSTHYGTAVHDVPGMCGVVDGGIVAGLWGYEAGQSGVGDIFGHFVETSVPAAYTEAAEARVISAHEDLRRRRVAGPCRWLSLRRFPAHHVATPRPRSLTQPGHSSFLAVGEVPDHALEQLGVEGKL
jgi:hypothetical protein